MLTSKKESQPDKKYNNKMDVLKPFSRFFREQKGITSLEYGLIVVAMGVALMFILYGEKGITEVIKDKFNEFSDIIMNAIVRV